MRWKRSSNFAACGRARDPRVRCYSLKMNRQVGETPHDPHVMANIHPIPDGTPVTTWRISERTYPFVILRAWQNSRWTDPSYRNPASSFECTNLKTTSLVRSQFHKSDCKIGKHNRENGGGSKYNARASGRITSSGQTYSFESARSSGHRSATCAGSHDPRRVRFSPGPAGPPAPDFPSEPDSAYRGIPPEAVGRACSHLPPTRRPLGTSRQFRCLHPR